MAYVPPFKRTGVTGVATSPVRLEERRYRATAKIRRRSKHRGSAETPTSADRAIVAERLPSGRIPLSAIEAGPYIVKLFNTPSGELGSDYYLIQREFAKRTKRPTALRYWLKVVAIVHQGGKVLVADSGRGKTVAIGSISADHVYNPGIISRVGTPPIPVTLAYRGVASALGEAREELRVRPSDVTGISVQPSVLVVPDRGRVDRATLYLFVDLTLNPSVTLRDLEARRLKDLAEGDSAFNETGALSFIPEANLLREVGERTRDLLK